MFAKANIPCGTRIISEQALLEVDINTEPMGNIITAFERLPPSQKKLYMELHGYACELFQLRVRALELYVESTCMHEQDQFKEDGTIEKGVPERVLSLDAPMKRHIARVLRLEIGELDFCYRNPYSDPTYKQREYPKKPFE